MKHDKGGHVYMKTPKKKLTPGRNVKTRKKKEEGPVDQVPQWK
jgi:hypothetical protein